MSVAVLGEQVCDGHRPPLQSDMAMEDCDGSIPWNLMMEVSLGFGIWNLGFLPLLPFL